MDPKLNLDGKVFHNSCAKCADCQCQITVSNFAKSETGGQITLLCKTHYFKRFHEGGAYLGGEKYSKQAPRDLSKDSVAAAAASPVRTGAGETEPGGKTAAPAPVPVPDAFTKAPESGAERRPSFSPAERRGSASAASSTPAPVETPAAPAPAATEEEPVSAPPPVPATTQAVGESEETTTVFNTETIQAATDEAAAAVAATEDESV